MGRPETDWARDNAITELGHGLKAGGRYDEALAVCEVDLATMRRHGASEFNQLIAHTSIADCYEDLGRNEELLAKRRDIYERMVKLRGAAHPATLIDATRLAEALIAEGCYREARSFSAQQSRVARRVLGSESRDTLDLRVSYAISLYKDDVSRLDAALAILVDTHQTARRVFSDAHPITRAVQQGISEARACQPDGAADAAR